MRKDGAPGMVRAKPELFYAYVGTGQVADSTKNYSVAYDALLKKAQAIGNQQALEELRRVGPPPYSSGEGYQVQRRWANNFEGADQFLPGTLGLTLVAPGSSVPIPRIDPGPAQGVRVHPRLRALCRVHVLRSVSEGACYAGQPACRRSLNIGERCGDHGDICRKTPPLQNAQGWE